MPTRWLHVSVCLLRSVLLIWAGNDLSLTITQILRQGSSVPGSVNMEGAMFDLTCVCSSGVSTIYREVVQREPSHSTHLQAFHLSRSCSIHSSPRADITQQKTGHQVQISLMSSHRILDKARARHEALFHKKRFWQPADQNRPHHDPNHAGFCLRNLETGFYQAMRLYRRYSSSEDSASQSRRVRVVDSAEASSRSLPSHIDASLY